MTGLVIWGRANSVNVQKVLWCCDELGLAFDRRDAGMKFGVVDTPEYRAMNPNGRVPTLVDGDVVLWESHSILRYLALRQIERDTGARSIYPDGPAARARVNRWLDWVLSTLQPAERALFWGMVRTRPDDRDMSAIDAAAKASGEAWQVLDAHLAHGHPYAEGDSLTLADIALGAYARRWFGVEVKHRPDLPRLQAWYERLGERPPFQRHVAPPLT
ncbi:glutathione S-transferase family protein [Pararoseomonas indoligenes]|uniref:Glutathione S-transferase N-terminal domain-containing protein n=1 Tax=Roseomonas indoligenes TaxID=2820811 RepID=A0A940N2L7_9PROT|nr:glutathione S-transferase N-terminal domain-containing protein [Pararoseomonas indoligenes]MBP0495429.1 glutathione S-transferase N-terminal domain-containing protein [Pararoseomonas indoligenes]